VQRVRNDRQHGRDREDLHRGDDLEQQQAERERAEATTKNLRPSRGAFVFEAANAVPSFGGRVAVRRLGGEVRADRR